MRQIVVFDFDNTLSTFDTIYPFFVFCNKNGFLLLTIKKLIWLISKIFVRFNIISNIRLKQIGIFIFINKYSKNYIQEASSNFFKVITYHQKVVIQLNKYLDNSTVYISSASFGEYLDVFTEKYNPVTLLCSTIKYANQKVTGLKFNNYAENKILYFQENNIKKIDILFTDSYSDQSLAKISKKIILVKSDGKLIEINSYSDFLKYFNK